MTICGGLPSSAARSGDTAREKNLITPQSDLPLLARHVHFHFGRCDGNEHFVSS